MGDLVGVIANSGQFPKQGGVGVGRTGAEFYAHDAVADQGAGTQAGDGALPQAVLTLLLYVSLRCPNCSGVRRTPHFIPFTP